MYNGLDLAAPPKPALVLSTDVFRLHAHQVATGGTIFGMRYLECPVLGPDQWLIVADGCLDGNRCPACGGLVKEDRHG